MAHSYPEGRQHSKGKKRNRGAHRGSDAAISWLQAISKWPKHSSDKIDLTLSEPQKLRRVAGQNRGDAM